MPLQKRNAEDGIRKLPPALHTPETHLPVLGGTLPRRDMLPQHHEPYIVVQPQYHVRQTGLTARVHPIAGRPAHCAWDGRPVGGGVAVGDVYVVGACVDDGRVVFVDGFCAAVPAAF